MTTEDDREWAEIEKEIQKIADGHPKFSVRYARKSVDAWLNKDCDGYSFYEEKTVKHRYMIVMIEKKEDINAETGTEVLRAAPGAGVEAGPGVP